MITIIICIAENMSFSPFGLYSNLSIMATCSNVETVNEEFNNLLGFNKDILYVFSQNNFSLYNFF